MKNVIDLLRGKASERQMTNQDKYAEIIRRIAGAEGEPYPADIESLEELMPQLNLTADDVEKHIEAMKRQQELQPEIDAEEQRRKVNNSASSAYSNWFKAGGGREKAYIKLEAQGVDIDKTYRLATGMVRRSIEAREESERIKMKYPILF